MQKNKHDRNLQPAINKSRTETLKNPGQSCFYSPVLLAMLMKILLPCRHSAPDMPLRFIGVKHLACLLGKGGIDLEEPFGDILMYRTLADPELLRCLPHRRAVFYNIICNLHGPLLNIIFQKNPPANIVFTMYAGGRKVMLVYFSPLYLKLHIIFIFLTVSKIYFVFFLSISFDTFTFIPNVN